MLASSRIKIIKQKYFQELKKILDIGAFV